MSDALASLVGDFLIKERHVTMTPSAQQVAGPDPTRWGLVFSVNAVGNVWLATTDASILPAGGTLISGNAPIWSPNFRDLGALVNIAWFGLQVTPGAIASIIEILYRPSGPTIGLDDLAKELAQLRRQATRIPDHYHRQLSELQAQLSSRPLTAGRK
jgi:hypothetical protein